MWFLCKEPGGVGNSNLNVSVGANKSDLYNLYYWFCGCCKIDIVLKKKRIVVGTFSKHLQKQC